MKILAIDSSGQVASVALLDDGVLRCELTANNGLTHSQTLLPMLEQLRRQLELDLATIDAVAVAGGPGSFTGLRIGASTAKGIALALKVPIIPVPTLEALACNCFGAAGLVCPMMDARRDQVYTGVYRFAGEDLITVHAQQAVPVPEIADRLNVLGEPVLLTGDGAAAYRGELEKLLTVPHIFAPAHMDRQRAGSVAVLAERYAAAGHSVPGSEFSPEYLRLSQAERERLARERREREDPEGKDPLRTEAAP